MSYETKPLITVKEARKLLGKESEVLSDDQVIEMIGLFTLLSKSNLLKKGSNNTVGINE